MPKSPTELKQIRIAQQNWAAARGLGFDQRGYVEHYERNLAAALSAAALESFRNGGGNELQDSPNRPAKMRALHSSSALAANVFDHWLGEPDSILRWLDLPGTGAHAAFEAKADTGLPGEPPNLDLLLNRSDGSLIGIESKFTEWLTSRREKAQPFKQKYFAGDTKLWARAGLLGCQDAAERTQCGEIKFRFLNAPQLLKHALGLVGFGRPFELVYLYFDAPSAVGELHASEAATFASLIKGDFALHIRTYQDVFRRIQSDATGADDQYVAYLKSRYFADSPS